ncbi:MAG TPA: hypothetical protein VN946_03965 [Terriglobales bacterium]|jgi:hypothetical protein|nr:hypothetical protein [Terriglobales bacterium]
MRRWLYIATFSLILLSLPAWAQRRGGGGGAHFASGGGHASASFHSPSASYRGGSYARGSSVIVRGGNPSYRRRAFYGSRFYYPYGGYYPYNGWYYDPLYSQGDYQADDQTADSYAGSYGPTPNPDDSGLRRDLESLNGKIDRLQADVEARNHPKAGNTEPATALVFRDQHVEEVHNYAIAGGTLWVLNEQAAKKIPLDQLDIAATTKANEDRGVDFQVPGPSLQLMITR